MNDEKTKLLELSPLRIGDKRKLIHYDRSANVDIPPSEDGEYYRQYEPLTKSQLLANYSNDVWWNNLRRGMMIGFWTSLIVMILSAIIIAYFHYDRVCLAKKSFLAAPIDVQPRTAYGLFPIDENSSLASSTESPQQTTTRTTILPFSTWLGP